ncbi:MAG: SprT family zinc-dependent metalloprotease [Sedimentibacter sp.]|uniref:M48 family metallopeptidase n=1 Tax=Sedimentibacter sp. TaxID=1960295 RepID=UPI0029828285|nr:SprT family zinc-dependent metalloprotease [Sedimentibacter sp.]MDW5299622.1 SprT family zinc-dependent metalloprotease [Sedimentibacter sp.]
MDTNTELRKVECEQRILEYFLTRKQVKNINLRVKPEGKVCVSANRNVPVKYIDDFIKSKQTYIIRALEKYEERKKYIIAPKKYVSGENFDILGKSLRLKVSESKNESVTTDGIFIFMTIKDKENQKRREKLMNDWLKEIRIEMFDQICRETYQIFKKYGVEYPIVKIRNMTSRWGSCNPKKNIITLNSKLIEAPRNSIEYVVLHEFAHFIHPNHSKKFYDFVAMLMPDWKGRKKELEKYI